jgi:hypothetical protein
MLAEVHDAVIMPGIMPKHVLKPLRCRDGWSVGVNLTPILAAKGDSFKSPVPSLVKKGSRV